MADAHMAIEPRDPLHGLSLPNRHGLVAVAAAPVSARFVYRGNAGAIAEAFGVPLPVQPCQSQREGERAALWLGPDEWLLLAPRNETDRIAQDLRRALSGQAASLVDVSHRNCGLVIDGPAAPRLLNAGCPLDLDPSAFPVGMCTRTLYAKAEIVLWRVAPSTFRVEVWRSFAPYLVEHLAVALADVD